MKNTMKHSKPFIVILLLLAGLTFTQKGHAMTDDSLHTEIATFGAGCFWCTEAFLESYDGVLDVVSGYMGGDVDDPSYKAVTTGKTGHAEVAQVKFNPDVVTYKTLLDLFWKMHDPTTLNRQGNDIGTQYRSGIYYHSPEQKVIAEASKQDAQKNYKKPIVTEVEKAGKFFPAEGYHQDYYQNNPFAPYSMYIRSKLKKLDLK